MNQRATHRRILKPWRRYVGLVLSVVWLSALVQPCVMAGSCDAADHGSPAVNQFAYDHGDCAQCSSGSTACDDCSTASNHACSKGDSTGGFDSTAAFEQQTKVKKFELLALSVTQLVNSQPSIGVYLLTALPESLPPDPSIIDLFRIYLK